MAKVGFGHLRVRGRVLYTNKELLPVLELLPNKAARVKSLAHLSAAKRYENAMDGLVRDRRPSSTA